MKKVFSILTLALLLLSFTACNDKNDDSTEYSFTSTQLNKAVELSNPANMKVSTSTASAKWIYAADSRISITTEVQINDNTTAKLTITEALMDYDATQGRFEFTAANGGNGITQVKGYFGVNGDALTLYIEFIYNGTHFVSSVSQLAYPFVSATSIDTENPGTPFKNDNMQLIIVVKPSDMTAQMRFFNVKYAENQSRLDHITVTEGLTVTAIPNGYRVTGTELATDVTGFTIDNFEANVSNNGLNVIGTFLANDKYNVSFNGTMFGIVTP